MATKERGEEKRWSPLPPTDTLEAQKGLRKQLSDDKSFTEQKKRRRKADLGEVTKLAQQSAARSTQFGAGGKKGGESMSGKWLELG